ncbi:hypothetical protein C8Q77DRAFT_1067158 [Trametes polyzona]|nr:hypothetical protein C8Q77DRAFT_1067158 [Trametes polyzona]
MSEASTSVTSTRSSCTCGQCFEGWLSPRMRERLEYSSELRYGLAKSLLDTQDGIPTDITRTLPIDYAQIDVAFYYLPEDLRAKISAQPENHVGATPGSRTARAVGDAIYRGYIAVFEVVKDLATSSLAEEEEDKPWGFPTVSALSKRLSELREPSAESESDSSSSISAAARAHLGAYLDAGGSAAHALDCIVDRAREELSPLGRQYDAEKAYIDAVLDRGGPACANDLDFALVRARLGLSVDSGGVDIPSEGDADGRDVASDEE